MAEVSALQTCACGHIKFILRHISRAKWCNLTPVCVPGGETLAHHQGSSHDPVKLLNDLLLMITVHFQYSVSELRSSHICLLLRLHVDVRIQAASSLRVSVINSDSVSHGPRPQTPLAVCRDCSVLASGQPPHTNSASQT